MTATPGLECATSTSEIVAAHLEREITLNAAHASACWEWARPVRFCQDWQGMNPDPGRQTEVRILWSKETLYLRFDCRYRKLFLFADSDASGRRDALWERDVAEIFLQPDRSPRQCYKEFEISPNGMWVDLDISPSGTEDLKSGLRRSAFLDEERHAWAAELAIPIQSLTAEFDPARPWRVNFFRIEGARESRIYQAWKPTMTPEPDFHVPEVFGELRFAPAPE